MEAAGVGESLRVFERFLEVAAMDHQLRSLSLHRGVLLAAVAARHDDDRVQPVHPRATAILWPKLPRVAAIAPSAAGSSRRRRSI